MESAGPPGDIDWGFVVQVVPPGVMAFYVAPTRVITAGLRTGPDTPLAVRGDMGRESPTRVVGSAGFGGDVRVSVLAAQEFSGKLLPWRTAAIPVGARWDSMALVGEAGLPARGAVVGRGSLLRLAPDAEFANLSLIGAPVIVEGAIAGVVVRERGDTYEAVAAGTVTRALTRWLPAAERELSPKASRIVARARRETAPDAAGALLMGVLLESRDEEPTFGRRLAQHLQATGRWTDASAWRAEPLGPDVAVAPTAADADFGGLVGVAYDLLVRTGGGDFISTRHLVAALMVGAPDSLAAAGADLSGFRGEFLQAIADFCPDDDLAAWREALARVGTATGPAARRAQVRAGFRPDDLGGPDQLGITPDVNMLCDVLVARDVEPPLSVGLFGDWGTGKSFFMRQMESRINALMKVARAEEAAGRTSSYCANVVQIRFNAWSYLDANLWANLALGIFERLASPPTEPGADLDLKQEEAEQARMAEERKLLLAELDTYKELHADVARDKEAALAQREEAAKELKRVTNEREREAKDLAAVRARDVIAELSDDEPLKAARDKAAAALRVDEVNVSELEALRADLSSLSGRARAVWRLLQKRQAVAVTAVAVIAVVVAGLVLILARARLAGLGAFLVSVTGGLVAFGKWVRPAVALTGEALDSIEKGVRRAETRERELREKQAREESVLAERVRALAAREAALAQQEAQTAAKVAETEQKLGELVQGRRLYRFLEERSTTTEYRQHLGIVALIRRDFERLTRLLKSDRSADAKLPCIDRIVLYVDDLDRCPPDRVVEVLQAVHLLLAFPIFVVVVGVDARWLLRSLENHYKEMLGRSEEEDDRDLAGWETSPQNYLEKIFQIPFALAPMDASGFSQLVRSLVTVAAAPTAPAPASEAPESTAPAILTSEAGEPLATETGQPLATEAPLVVTEELAAPAAAIDPNPPSLDITGEELDFVCALADAAVTPRLTKRLVNIYRLVRTSQSDEELARYVDDGDYQRVLILLTILVGFSALSGAVYQQLLDAPETETWAEFVEGLLPDDEHEDDDANEWRRLHGWLTDLAPSLKVDDSLAPYRRWVPKLARFSFETGRVRTA